MRRYVIVSAIFFSVLAVVQLTRTVAGWPAQVAGIAVPLWASAVACLVGASFAVWGFRSLSKE